MLFSDFYKIMVNKLTFVGFRGVIASISLPGSAPGSNVTVICRISESRPSFSYENTVAEGTNLMPVKAVHRNERFLCLVQIDKLCHKLE